MKLDEFWDQLSNWSQQTFGSDSERGHIGPLKHLAKEIKEVRENPGDLEEYADMVFLIFDASRRAGNTFQQTASHDPLANLECMVGIAIGIECQSIELYGAMFELCCGAAFKAGFSYDQLLGAVEAKLVKNRAREWPAPSRNDEPIEHVRN